MTVLTYEVPHAKRYLRAYSKCPSGHMALEQRQHLFNVIDLLGSDHIIQHLCTDSLVSVLSAVSNDVSWQQGPWSGTSSTVLTFQSFHGSLIWTASCKNKGSTQQKNVERRKTHTRTHTELKTSEPLNKMIGTFRGLDTLGRLSTVSDGGGGGGGGGREVNFRDLLGLLSCTLKRSQL